MKVTPAVFGVFHHFELAHQLHKRNHLQRIYSTWPWARLKHEGLPHSLFCCFPLLHTTDYLLNRTPLASPRISSKLASWNTLAFDQWTNSQIEPCDAFITISGAGLLTGHKVQTRGGKFICDRGSTHQRYQEISLQKSTVAGACPSPSASRTSPYAKKKSIPSPMSSP
jgi:hypothetical protein